VALFQAIKVDAEAVSEVPSRSDQDVNILITPTGNLDHVWCCKSTGVTELTLDTVRPEGW